MRVFIAIALAAACRAQRPEDPILAVFQQMEKAEQTGNGQAWLDLWSPSSRIAGNPDLKEMIRPRPSVRYRATKVLVGPDRAALVGTMDDQFLSMRFARENGVWKIADQTWSNVAIDPASLYAMLPPPEGSFARAGSPWETVATAVVDSKFHKPGEIRWKLSAARDESYVYVRIEGASELPPPNTEVHGTFPDLKSPVPRDWPVMKIRIPGPPPREYMLDIADGIGDQATFDEKGKANTHRHFVSYSLVIRKGDHEVFSAGAGTSSSALISVKDRFIDVRLPLKALGVNAAVKTRIEIVDANSVAQFLPYEVRARD